MKYYLDIFIGFRSRFLPLLLLLITTAPCACAQNFINLDLNECINIALSKSIDLEIKRLSKEKAQIDWLQQKANLLPTFNGGITYGLNQGRSINPLTNTYINHEVIYGTPRIGGTLLLFNGFLQQNIIKQYKLSYQSAIEEEKHAKGQLILEVMLAYLEVLTNQELLNLFKLQQNTSFEQLRRVEARHKNEAINLQDYYDLKGQYATDQLNLVNANDALEASKIGLVKLLNIPYKKKIQVESLSPDEITLNYNLQPEEVYEKALSQLSVVKAAKLRKRSSDFQAKAAQSGFFPSIFVNSSMGSNFSNSARDPFDKLVPVANQLSNNLSKSFNINISIPLFNSFRTKNAIALSAISQRESEAILQGTIAQLQRAVEQAYLDMTTSKERYLILKDQVQSYKNSFRVVESKFNLGVISAVDYLLAKNNFDKANINMLVNHYEYLIRRKIVDFYCGNVSY